MTKSISTNLLVLDNFRVGLEVVVLPAEVALHGVDRVGEDEGREARPLAQLHVRGFLRPAADQLRANLLLLKRTGYGFWLKLPLLQSLVHQFVFNSVS